MDLDADIINTSLSKLQLDLFGLEPNELIDTINYSQMLLAYIMSKNKEASMYINKTLNKNACVLQNQDIKDLKSILEEANVNSMLINKIDFMQKGGANETDVVTIESPSIKAQSVTAVSTVNSDPLGSITDFTKAAFECGLSHDQLFSLLDKALDIKKKEQDMREREIGLQSQLLTVKEMEINASTINSRFSNTFLTVGAISSMGISGSLVYYLKTAISSASNGIVNTTGNVVGGLAGTTELTVRNVVPYLLNVSKIVAKSAIESGYVPDSVTAVLKTGKSVVGDGYFKYATQSVSGDIAEKFATSIATNVDNAIIFSSLLLFIGMSCILILFLVVILKLYNTNSVKGYALTFGLEWKTKGGGKRRKTIRKKLKRRKTIKK